MQEVRRECLELVELAAPGGVRGCATGLESGQAAWAEEGDARALERGIVAMCIVDASEQVVPVWLAEAIVRPD